MINFKRLNFVLLGIFLSSSLGSTLLFAQQATSTYQPPSGQIIDGPVIRGQRVIQRQVIQGQPVQRQVIQGQPVQGQVIQGQPVQGQIIQGQIIQGQPVQGQPIIQGPVIQGRPIRGNVAQPQPAVPQANQQPSEELRKAIAVARAKIAKQAEDLKTLSEQNSKLSRVEDTNNAMRKEYARLKKAYEDVSKELDGIKLDQAMKPAEANDGEADAKLNQLNAQYQKAVEQNGTLSGQIEVLTEENDEIKNRLKTLSAAGGDMRGFKADLDSAKTRISEIEQQNNTLTSENNRLQGMLQSATSDNDELNKRFSTLTGENERLRTEYQTATETNTNLGQQVSELSTQNKDYLAAINARPAPVAPVQRKAVTPRRDSGLIAERDRALALNADLEKENKLLMEEISELEGRIGSVDNKAEPKTVPLVSAVPVVTGDAVSKFNILNWLIPFLLIGLTVGLYVFLTEDNGKELGALTSTVFGTDHDSNER